MTNYKKAVKKLISEFQLSPTRVDVENLANRLGVSIIEKSLEDSTSGLLITNQANSSYIVINKNHSPRRKRFSIAHELSHYFLHKNSADVFIDDLMTFHRDSNSSTGEDKKEIQANQLAAELLMPEEWVKNEVGQRFIDLHEEENIKELADKFDVSIQAMAFRLLNLNLLHRSF